MSWPPELVVATAVAAVAFLAGLLWLRARSRRTRSVGRPLTSGPSNLRFTCAGCSGQFTHSRRTIAAWERGGRRFFCNACHTKWQQNAKTPGRPTAQVPAASGKRSGGCLGVVLIVGVVIPGAVAIAFHLYA